MVTRRDVVGLVFTLPFAGIARAAAQEQPRFYIFGYVRNPGAYHLKDDTTVGDALDLAGGFAPRRNITAIEIIRVVDGEKQTFNASLTDAVLANDTISVK